jgi:LytS/YehU family sensor histidine kinase
VDNYLKIEEFRFEEKFDYKISVEDKVDIETNIPKMLIYTFVENSIKHGIRHLKTDGYLSINITRKNGSIIVEIEDNGVGRKKAAEYDQFSTGKGLKILDQIIQLFYDLEKVKISYEIKDLFDNFNNSKGTQVVITIPLSNPII